MGSQWSMVALLAIASCKGTADDSSPIIPDSGDSGTSGTDPIDMTILDNPSNPLSALAMVSVGDLREVELSYGEAGSEHTHSSPTWTLKAGTHELPVLGLYPADWEIELVIDGVATGTMGTIRTEEPSGLQRPIVETYGGSWSAEEAICGSFESPTRYQCFDRQGRPTLWIDLPGNAMFIRPLADGSLLAHPDGPPFLYHFSVTGREIDRLSLEEIDGLEHEHHWIDEHDVVEILEGSWAGAWAILTATEEEQRIAPGLIVVDPQTREALWDWSAHGAPGDGQSVDPERLPYDRSGVFSYEEDWLHANALVHTLGPEGGDRFWMSLRHQDWVIRIDAPSGDIGPRLGWGGDFELVEDLESAGAAPLPPEQWSYHQHAVELRRITEDRLEIQLFDNGNARRDEAGEVQREPMWSRAVRYLVDEGSLRATVDWSYGEPPPGEEHFFGEAAGDADRQPDAERVLITKSVDGAFIREVDAQGTVLWNAEIEGEGELYRAEFYPSLYETSWSTQTDW